MAGIPYKNGFNPVSLDGAVKYTGSQRIFQTSVAAGAIFAGDPVFLNANGNVEAGVTPTSTTNCIGVAVGGFWIDPTTKQPVESRYIPANTSSAAGVYNGINFTADAGPGVKVVLAGDEQVFAVKSENSVARSAIGDRISLATSAGNTATGQTGTRVSAATNAVSPVVVADVLRADEYLATPSSAGGTAVNDWNAPETVILVKLLNFGETL